MVKANATVVARRPITAEPHILLKITKLKKIGKFQELRAGTHDDMSGAKHLLIQSGATRGGDF